MNTNFCRWAAILFSNFGLAILLAGCGPQPGPAPTAAPVTQSDQAVLEKIRNRRAGKAPHGNNPPTSAVPPSAP